MRPKTKLSWNWEGFKEGLVDEGIPLAGATLGAGLGGLKGSALRGAALGYAAGGGASILRSKLKGEEPSLSRKLLAASALGYGLGGLSHWGLEHATHGAPVGSIRQKMFHPNTAVHPHGTFVSNLTEEALPALGATLGTGVAMATHNDHGRAEDGVHKSASKLASDPSMFISFSEELLDIIQGSGR